MPLVIKGLISRRARYGLLVTVMVGSMLCPWSLSVQAQTLSNAPTATQVKVASKAPVTKNAAAKKTAAKPQGAAAAKKGKAGAKRVAQPTAGKIVPVSRSSDSNERNLLIEAYSYLGTPYVYGGAGPSGFDCSGFVRYIFSLYGIDLPHNAAAQASCGKAVDRSSLQPGDIVLFGYYGSKSINHSGIYTGNGKFIHASSSARGVVVSSLTSGYYAENYKGARRVLR